MFNVLLFFIAAGFGLLISCTTQAPPVEKEPVVVVKQKPGVYTNKDYSEAMKSYSLKISQIEEKFLQSEQNCPTVLELAHGVDDLEKIIGKIELPPFASLAVSICEVDCPLSMEEAGGRERVQFALFSIDIFIQKYKNDLINKTELYRYQAALDRRLGEIKKAMISDDKAYESFINLDKKMFLMLIQSLDLLTAKKAMALRPLYEKLKDVPNTPSSMISQLSVIDFIIKEEKDDDLLVILKRFNSLLLTSLNRDFAGREFEVKLLLYKKLYHEAHKAAEKVKQSFPTPFFTLQIDALFRTEVSVENTKTEETLNNVVDVDMRAKEFIEEGNTKAAIDLIDRYKEAPFFDKLEKTRKKAVSDYIRQLRFEVTTLHSRSKFSAKGIPEKQKLLEECARLLNDILVQFPEYEDKVAIEKNLHNIQKEMALLDKMEK